MEAFTVVSSEGRRRISPVSAMPSRNPAIPAGIFRSSDEVLSGTRSPELARPSPFRGVRFLLSRDRTGRTPATPRWLNTYRAPEGMPIDPAGVRRKATLARRPGPLFFLPVLTQPGAPTRRDVRAGGWVACRLPAPVFGSLLFSFYGTRFFGGVFAGVGFFHWLGRRTFVSPLLAGRTRCFLQWKVLILTRRGRMLLPNWHSSLRRGSGRAAGFRIVA
jgi:hypothetical protein